MKSELTQQQYLCFDVSLGNKMEYVLLHFAPFIEGVGLKTQEVNYIRVPRVIAGRNAFRNGVFTPRFMKTAGLAGVESIYGTDAAFYLSDAMAALAKIKKQASRITNDGFCENIIALVTDTRRALARAEKSMGEGTPMAVRLYGSVLKTLGDWTKGESDPCDEHEAERRKKAYEVRKAKKAEEERIAADIKNLANQDNQENN